MEGLLTPVSTTYKTPPGSEIILVATTKALKAPEQASKSEVSFHRQASTPAEALEILRNEPDYGTLVSTLRFLARGNDDFRITSPSPITAQLMHVLVSDTVLTYWDTFFEARKEKSPQRNVKKSGSKSTSDLEILLSCLQSISGLNAILLGLKQYIQHAKEAKKAIGGPRIQEALGTLLQLLQTLLEGNQTVESIWKTIYQSSNDPLKQKAIWNEFLVIISGGKLLGIAAEAEDVTNELSKDVGQKHWITDGTSYSTWLAANITSWARALPLDSETGWRNCGELLGKSFRLGHTEVVVKNLLDSLVLRKSEDSPKFTKLLNVLPSFEQRSVLYSILKILSKEYFLVAITTEDNSLWWQADASTISAAAGLIDLVVASNETRKSQLVSWLTGPFGAGLGDGIDIRRAVVAALATDKTIIEKVLDKSLQQFSDQLYIKHTPILQQEVHTQVLLLSAGYVHRKAPLHLSMMMRSGAQLSAISNRLATSSPRARFLGMAVGEALSSLVDKGDKIMDFKVDEMSTAEAKWYKSLVNVADNVGSLELLKPGTVTKQSKKPRPQETKPKPKVSVPGAGSKIVAIEEIETDKEEEEDSDVDGLTPYAKPDSDVEDSDEDATLITRNKATAPVYIRDLIICLRDSENYDRQNLGLSTAASLIRRKANFGTEVSVHAEELASLLLGIQDKYEIENFPELRLRGMIAVLIALPEKMGQWFSKTFFDGDYSISQRASILTTLGLGARELGGFGPEDSYLTSSAKSLLSTSFPSKNLPEAMQKYYSNTPSQSTTSTSNLKALPPTALDILSTSLTNIMITPIASNPKVSGPQILNLRTSSRIAVESKRPKPTTNALAKIVSTSFFFPLTGRFFIHLRTYGSSSNNISFHPFLLTLFLKTLALLLHASGPSTLSLPQMTSEFFNLLLSLRTQAVSDTTVLEAILFGFMTILEINEDKRNLVENHGRELLETQEWVQGVFERLGDGLAEQGEDARVRTLAAGCLVRISECVEKYQALLMGDLASFGG